MGTLRPFHSLLAVQSPQPPFCTRLFELARSGRFQHLDTIEQQLKSEGYEAVSAHLAGSSIRRQIKKILRDFARPPGGL